MVNAPCEDLGFSKLTLTKSVIEEMDGALVRQLALENDPITPGNHTSLVD